MPMAGQPGERTGFGQSLHIGPIELGPCARVIDISKRLCGSNAVHCLAGESGDTV